MMETFKEVCWKNRMGLREFDIIRKEFMKFIEEKYNPNKTTIELYNMKSQKVEVNEDEIISKVLQKLPSPSITSQSLNKDEIIKEVLLRVPKSVGSVVYEVVPQEKLKRDYQENTKQMLLSEISELSGKAKEILKWIESNNKVTTKGEVVKKIWNFTTSANQTKDFKQLEEKNLVKKDNSGRLSAFLKDRIKNTLAVYNPTEEEIINTYNHILMEMLK